MEEPRRSLAKANRQFHEVRDEIAKVDVRLEEVQAKNAKYLEEISLLDSEVTRICARAATSEQRLAEMFDEKMRSQELREEQEAAESQVLASRRSALEAAREAAARLEADNAAQARAHEQRQASDVAARQRVAANIKDLECKHSAQKSVAETSRRRAEKLQEELVAERNQQEDLHRKLRQALEAEASSKENQQILRDTVSSKGGDPSANPAGFSDVSAEAETAELRSELATKEETCRRLRATLSEEHDRISQTVASLTSALDGSRDEIQRMAQAAAAHRDEEKKLEEQIQAERQTADREAAEEAAAAQRLDRVKGTLAELRERPRKPPTQAGNAKLAAEQLRKVQDEVAAIEVQCQERQDEVHRLERQRSAVEAEGIREAQQVKAKIQEIWRRLAVAAAGDGFAVPREQ